MHAKKIFLVRHGETEWSLSGQHTGKTDIPLTLRGEKQAALLGPLLQKMSITKAFVSPLKRAKDTFSLTGLSTPMDIDEDLEEWDYGEYEGLTTLEIHKKNPDWDLFSHGAPNGESPTEIQVRAARVLQKALLTEGNVIFFSSGHISRCIAATWLDCSLSLGKHLVLSPASISELGYEHSHPAILLWNRTIQV